MIDNLPILYSFRGSSIKDEFDVFYGDDSDEDTLDLLDRKYPYKILDIFSKQLDNDSDEIKLLNDRYFLLSNEHKYLEFIQKVFMANNELCVVKTEFFRLDYFRFLEYINEDTDKMSQVLLLHNYIKFKDSKETVFIMKDWNLLRSFLIFTLRGNLIFRYFYFPKDPLLLVSNYDMSLPIFSIDASKLDHYSEVCRKYNLFLR